MFKDKKGYLIGTIIILLILGSVLSVSHFHFFVPADPERVLCVYCTYQKELQSLDPLSFFSYFIFLLFALQILFPISFLTRFSHSPFLLRAPPQKNYYIE